jgi:hypothetical protein
MVDISGDDTLERGNVMDVICAVLHQAVRWTSRRKMPRHATMDIHCASCRFTR